MYIESKRMYIESKRMYVESKREYVESRRMYVESKRMYVESKIVYVEYIYNIRTLSVNIKFICTSFRNRQNSEPSASFSGLFRSEYK
jgi:hypothetical protein